MLFGGKNAKAQSAMEYLMTYGWAILIIAIVLAALFALGVFSSGSFIGTSCIAASGFQCSNPLLHSSTFTATLGQSTGTTWTSANVVFVSGGGTPPAIGTNGLTNGGSGTCADNANSLTSGATFTASFTGFANGASSIASTGTVTCTSLSTSYSTVGSAISGSLWAAYQIAGTSGTLWTQVATVTLKAT